MQDKKTSKVEVADDNQSLVIRIQIINIIHKDCFIIVRDLDDISERSINSSMGPVFRIISEGICVGVGDGHLSHKPIGTNFHLSPQYCQ